MTELWNHEFMGVTIGQIIAALLILTAAVMIRRWFSTTVLRHIHARVGPANPALHDTMSAALGPPMRFIPIVVAIFAISQIVATSPELRRILAEVNRSLITLTLFWVLFGSIAPLVAALGERMAIFGDAMSDWAVRLGKALVVLIGAAAILEIWGIRVGPVLAGLGIFGAAVALGAQDLFRNLIAGIFIIAERRFQNGDWIRADNVVEGTVETIGLRTTRVRGFDLAPVFVPNSKLADNAVTNYSQMTHRRISWIVGVEYDTSVDQLRRIRDGIEAYILGNEDFMRPPDTPAFVRVDKFNDSSIDLMVYCFTRTTAWGEWLQIKESLAYAIKGIVEDAGSGFAFPSRSLYVETLPSGTEIFPLQQPQPTADDPSAAVRTDPEGNARP
ncbi:MAG: mechanosensitive ion channel family protein [Burkholderiaceae bacterium]|nr:mechanosensitive ion channel family protein [Burkholderiaceae bacterium]MEB2318087.1 mechanosensitive ion channel family protein [Pseudomonadota bacterium]